MAIFELVRDEDGVVIVKLTTKVELSREEIRSRILGCLMKRWKLSIREHEDEGGGN